MNEVKAATVARSSTTKGEAHRPVFPWDVQKQTAAEKKPDNVIYLRERLERPPVDVRASAWSARQCAPSLKVLFDRLLEEIRPRRDQFRPDFVRALGELRDMNCAVVTGAAYRCGLALKLEGLNAEGEAVSTRVTSTSMLSATLFALLEGDDVLRLAKATGMSRQVIEKAVDQPATARISTVVRLLDELGVQAEFV